MQNSSISDKNQNYILSLFQTEEYKQNGSIEIFVDNSSPLLNSDEVINFFTEQLISHPQTRSVIFDYTRGKTHSNINHSSFIQLVKALHGGPLIVNYNVEIVGATGQPNTAVKIDGLVLSGNKPAKNLKELNDEMVKHKADTNKFDPKSSRFYKTLEFKRFLQLLSSVELIYSTRFDEHLVWKMDQMTTTQKEKFCSPYAEKDQSLREEFFQHVLIPEDIIILSTIGKTINIPKLTLGNFLENMNYMRTEFDVLYNSFLSSENYTSHLTSSGSNHLPSEIIAMLNMKNFIAKEKSANLLEK